jgi:hypothetical protein
MLRLHHYPPRPPRHTPSLHHALPPKSPDKFFSILSRELHCAKAAFSSITRDLDKLTTAEQHQHKKHLKAFTTLHEVGEVLDNVNCIVVEMRKGMTGVMFPMLRTVMKGMKDIGVDDEKGEGDFPGSDLVFEELVRKWEEIKHEHYRG